MIWWSHLSSLGGLNVTALLALAIAAWLAAAHCWRLALSWCLLFGAVLALAAASQMAFLGWGIGIRALDFTGCSGHAARAAAVFPVALFLLLDRRPESGGGRARDGGLALGMLIGAAVGLARIEVGAHSASEALAGLLLGALAAVLFVAHARTARPRSPQPLLLGLLAGIVLLPHADPQASHQWLTAAALKLSGSDRVWLRRDWEPAQGPYVPPCAPSRVRYDYLCM
jgi:membrane-associated phospholipid phosphatase